MDAVTVLVVDDDRLMLDMLPRRLRLCSLPMRAILTAGTPDEALRSLGEATDGPLVVVSDFNLKAAMNGADVLGEVRRRRPDALRVLMSGYSLEQLGHPGETVHHFFEKPLNLDELVHPLCAAIRARFGA